MVTIYPLYENTKYMLTSFTSDAVPEPLLRPRVQCDFLPHLGPRVSPGSALPVQYVEVRLPYTQKLQRQPALLWGIRCKLLNVAAN